MTWAEKLNRCQRGYLRKPIKYLAYQHGLPPHVYSLQKKGPALYDHSLPVGFISTLGVSTPEIMDPPWQHVENE